MGRRREGHADAVVAEAHADGAHDHRRPLRFGIGARRRGRQGLGAGVCGEVEGAGPLGRGSKQADAQRAMDGGGVCGYQVAGAR